MQHGYITSVPIKVTVSSNYQNADLRYQVSGDGNTWGYKKYENVDITTMGFKENWKALLENDK